MIDSRKFPPPFSVRGNILDSLYWCAKNFAAAFALAKEILAPCYLRPQPSPAIIGNRAEGTKKINGAN